MKSVLTLLKLIFMLLRWLCCFHGTLRSVRAARKLSFLTHCRNAIGLPHDNATALY